MDKTPAIPAHEIRPEFEYVYHWHRIIPAVASLAIGIGAVLWFWPTSLPNEKAEAAKAAEPLAGGPLKAKSIVVELPFEAPATTATEPSKAVAQVEEKSAKAADKTTGTSTTVALSSPVKQTAPTADTKPAAQPTASQTGDAKTSPTTPAVAAVSSEPQKVAALKAVNEAPAPAAGMKPGQVKVIDSTVKNVSLRQVIDHDPLDLNKGSIGLTKQKAVKVVFGANVGKPNEQVNYLWYLNGKLQAKVATRSGGDFSSVSSKFISYDAPGMWQVQMTNAQGTVLAESAFNAKRIQ